jgi:hypothetical protein
MWLAAEAKEMGFIVVFHRLPKTSLLSSRLRYFACLASAIRSSRSLTIALSAYPGGQRLGHRAPNQDDRHAEKWTGLHLQ